MVTQELQHEIEQFLYHEAGMLDGGEYRVWLTLFADDLHYWMPVRETTRDRNTDVRNEAELALFDDDKKFLSNRIARLEGGLAHAETPPSRTRRFISNVRVKALKNRDLEVLSNILVYQTRQERTETMYIGRREDVLRRLDGKLQISRRKIVLDHTLIPRSISILF